MKPDFEGPKMQALLVEVYLSSAARLGRFCIRRVTVGNKRQNVRKILMLKMCKRIRLGRKYPRLTSYSEVNATINNSN